MRVPVNAGAQRWLDPRPTVDDDRGRGNRGDRVLDLDVEYVEGRDQVRERLRLYDEAIRVGIRYLGCESGIARCLGVDLRRRVREECAVLVGGYARRNALGLRENGCLTLGKLPPAWIRHPTGAHCWRRLQLVQIRGTNRAVVAAAEAHGLDGGPLESDLVGVGIEPQGVARISVAAVQREPIGPRLFVYERQT